MEEKDPHLFSQLQTRKNAVTGLDFEIIPFDSDDERDKEIAEFVEAQINGIEGLEDIMLDLLDAIGKGFAVSEIMWAYEAGRVVVSDIRSRYQKRFFWDSEDAFRVRTDEAPRGDGAPEEQVHPPPLQGPQRAPVPGRSPPRGRLDVPVQELHPQGLGRVL